MPNGHEQKLPTGTVQTGASSQLFCAKDDIRTFVLCQIKRNGDAPHPPEGGDIPADLAALGLVGGPAVAHRVQLRLKRIELIGEGLKLGARRDAVARKCTLHGRLT